MDLEALFETFRPEDNLPDLRERLVPGSVDEDRVVEQVFRYYRAHGFPYTELDDLGGEFLKLKRTGSVLDGDTITQSMLGLTIANHYHPEMMSVPCRNCRTPMDVFNDDVLFRKAIRHRVRFARNLQPWGIRKAVCSLSRTQTVSNFRPSVAKTIYEHFKPSLTVDFCAGWGGRLLGALASGAAYVGIDPHGVAVTGNQRMVSDLRGRFSFPEPTLIVACAEDVLGKGTYRPDLVFTSPPYFDAERYSNEPTQSYVRYPTLDAWYERFLSPCIVGSYRDLRPQGHLVLNVNPDMMERTTQYALGAGFQHVRTWQMVLSRHQYNKKHNGLYRYEPVLVFRKA